MRDVLAAAPEVARVCPARHVCQGSDEDAIRHRSATSNELRDPPADQVSTVTRDDAVRFVHCRTRS